MLSKSKRLTKVQFDEVFKKGRVFHSPVFVMRALLDTRDTRFSVVSSKKVTPKASKRNLHRRFVYAAIRDIIIKIKKPVWVALFIKNDVSIMKRDEIISALSSIFVKSGVLE